MERVENNMMTYLWWILKFPSDSWMESYFQNLLEKARMINDGGGVANQGIRWRDAV